MRLLIFLIAGLMIVSEGIGQIKPDFLPEDLQVTEVHDLKCYCKPGIANKFRSKGLSLSYGLNTGGGYEETAEGVFLDTPSNLDKLSQLKFKIKIPVLIKERTKILLGYQYYSEFYQFERVGLDYEATFQNLNNNNLKKNSYSIIVSHSLSEDNYLALRYNYSVNGNYEGWVNFNSKFAVNKVIGIYGFKKSDNFEWGLGLILSKSFRRFNALPFLLYNRNFTPKWGIESVFPANVFLRYNINPSSITAIGMEYGSESFRLLIEDTTPLDYAFNHSELAFVWSLERHLTSWIWTNIKVGFQRNFSSDFESKNINTTTFFAEPKNSLLFRIGIFISPDLE